MMCPFCGGLGLSCRCSVLDVQRRQAMPQGLGGASGLGVLQTLLEQGPKKMHPQDEEGRIAKLEEAETKLAELRRSLTYFNERLIDFASIEALERGVQTMLDALYAARERRRRAQVKP